MKKLLLLTLLLLNVLPSYSQCIDSLLNGSDPYFTEIKKCLIGKRLFLLRLDWLRPDEKGVEHWEYDNYQYVDVLITDVNQNGTYFDEDIRIEFDAGKYGKGAVHVTTSVKEATGDKAFHKVFALNDPRKLYPKISKSRWKDIQHGQVQIGMSELECELSWGKPKDINRTTNRYGNREQWVYTGGYLYFKNGRLESIQN